MNLPPDLRDLERRLGIQRTVSPSFTRRDAEELTRKKLHRSPFWNKRKKR